MKDQRESRMDRWAAPQRRFDAIRAEAQRHAGRFLSDLAYANLHDGPPPAVRAALHAAIDGDRSLSLQYTPYGGATIPRRLVAQSLRKSLGAEFQYRDIILTPGAMAGLNLLFRSLDCEPSNSGEAGEVIVLVPCWLDYPLYLENLGLRPRLVPLDPERFDLDLDAIASALGPNTRAVILSQPGNPTGRVYPRDQLEALARLLESHSPRPLLISDECHREVVFGDTEFVSPISLYDRTCVVYSFGKALSIQGQRIGYVAVSPQMRNSSDPNDVGLSAQLEFLSRAMGFATPTALMQSALGALLKIEHDWTAVRHRRESILDAFTKAGVEIELPEATFFLYLPIGDRDDFDVTEALAEQGVLVLPSALFHDQGHLRLSLTCSDEALERAIPILVEAIAETRSIS